MNKELIFRRSSNHYLTHAKRDKGITLIALVVTIVVLLILAGISISMLSGESGIITKANEASDATEIGNIKSEIQLEILEKESKNITVIKKSEFEAILENYGEISEDGIKLITDPLKTDTKKSYEILISDIYSEDFADEDNEETKIDITTFYIEQVNEVCSHHVVDNYYNDYIYYKIIGDAKDYNIYYFQDTTGYTFTEEQILQKGTKYNGENIQKDCGDNPTPDAVLNSKCYIYLSDDNKSLKSDVLVVELGSLCFEKETLVNTKNGFVKIENVKVGDEVYTLNEENNKIELNKVLNIFEHKISDKMCNIELNGEFIKSTLNHPYYTKNRGWVDAIELKKGDILVNVSQQEVVLTKDAFIDMTENVYNVYNLEIENNHNYFVGEESVLVHNANSSWYTDYVCAYSGMKIYGNIYEIENQ